MGLLEVQTEKKANRLDEHLVFIGVGIENLILQAVVYVELGLVGILH